MCALRCLEAPAPPRLFPASGSRQPPGLYSEPWAGWEEHSISNREGVSEPLLDKGCQQLSVRRADRRGTITLLLHYSAYDLPLLLLAFSAGGQLRSCRAVLLQAALAGDPRLNSPAAGALAALGQALIPFYTGRIIDYASIDPRPQPV